MQQDLFLFREPISFNAEVVSWDIFREHNVDDFCVTVTEDMRGIFVDGAVKNPDFYAKVIVEVIYTNSSAKLVVVDLIVSPYPTSAATIQTCDSSGNLLDAFDVGEGVYISGTGYAPSTEHSIGLVPDSEVWLTGMDIQRMPGTTARVSPNSEGVITPTLVWENPQSPGEYDIVLDINGDGLFEGGVDQLDNSDGGSTGGFAIHELGILFPLILSTATNRMQRANRRSP